MMMPMSEMCTFETLVDVADALWYVSEFLDYADILSLRITNLRLRDAMDEAFFASLSERLYGTEFWARALRRPASTSHPLSTQFAELQRLEAFQRRMVALGEARWTPQKFYAFWASVDAR